MLGEIQRGKNKIIIQEVNFKGNHGIDIRLFVNEHFTKKGIWLRVEEVKKLIDILSNYLAKRQVKCPYSKEQVKIEKGKCELAEVCSGVSEGISECPYLTKVSNPAELVYAYILPNILFLLLSNFLSNTSDSGLETLSLFFIELSK